MKFTSRYYEPLLITLFRISDGIIGAFLFWLFFLLIYVNEKFHIEAALLIFLLINVSFFYVGIYRSWRTASVFLEFRKIIQGSLLVYFLLFTISYLLEISYFFPRKAIIPWMFSFPAILIFQRAVVRLLLRYLRKKGKNIKRAVVVGSGKLGIQLAHWVNENPWSGTRIVGFFSGHSSTEVEGYPLLGTLDELPGYIYNNPHRVDIVYIALPMREMGKIKMLVNELSDSTCSIYLIPDIFIFDFLQNSSVMYHNNIPVFSIVDTPIRGINYLVKQFEDIVLGSLFLLPAIPIMLLISVAIKLTSSGPVFFKQWRYGLDGKTIQIWKFRTMTVCEDGFDFKQATKSDPRVTRIGALLRRTSLDELPQLFNVLQGRMSIVGPRPHPVAMNEKYRKELKGYMQRHKIKPGLTGLAQINGYRGETDTYEKIKRRVDFDLQYLRNWSLFLDLKILFVTFFHLLKGENAH